MEFHPSNALSQRLKARRENASAVASLPYQRLHGWLAGLLGLLFPHLEEGLSPAACVDERIRSLQAELVGFLQQLNLDPRVAEAFFTVDLPEIDSWLTEDADCIYKGDPAATSVDEVILAYPGFLGVAIYRLAHALLERGVPVIPRLMTEYGHQLTGIDIHPGARIGRRFCIDHGTGVVIGESSWIGDDVKLYQGVTLGALSVEKAMAHTRRHPTIEDRVVIYANATILGGETVIGHDSVIGGNVWVTRSIDPWSLVYHTPQIQVRSQKTFPLEYMI